MKKLVLVIIFLIVSLSVSAQGFYFDIGTNFLIAEWYSKTYDGYYDDEQSVHTGFYPTYFGLNIGFGPFGRIPVYTAVELNINNYSLPYIGFAGIFYPVSMVQLGFSAGISIKNINFFNPDPFIENPVFAWSVSAALDTGRTGNSGILVGLRFSSLPKRVYSYQPFYNLTVSNSDLSIFVKYTFRKRASPPPPPPFDINRAIVRASRDIINQLPENSRIAILGIFSDDSSVAAFTANELQSQLISSGKLTVADYSGQGYPVFTEITDTSAFITGKSLGTDIVITGSITGTGANQRLNIKALDTRTEQLIFRSFYEGNALY